MKTATCGTRFQINDGGTARLFAEVIEILMKQSMDPAPAMNRLRYKLMNLTMRGGVLWLSEFEVEVIHGVIELIDSTRETE